MSGERSTGEPSADGTEGGDPDTHVLVLAAPSYDRELLLEALEPRYSVEATVDVDRLDEPFDCCLLDEAAFRRLVDAGATEPAASDDPFRPYVLLLDPESALADRASVWDHVDDVVTLPVSTVELTTRVGNLIDHRRSEQRTAERARTIQRQNDRLEEFASIVSHDLRNPLNVAEGHLSGARERSSDEALDEVAWAHDRMRRLIEDVLAVAREGAAATEPEPVDLATAAGECWRGVDTGAATLVVDTERTIEADPDGLGQLLGNLFRNAVEHGGADVTVTVGDLDDGFYVADDGPGIPAEDLERVFETGFTTNDDGTGLGLEIVRRTAGAHDWTVSAAEADGGGARFAVRGVDAP